MTEQQQPRAELGATMDDLLRIIGQQAVEIQLLRAELARLAAPQRALNGKRATVPEATP